MLTAGWRRPDDRLPTAASSGCRHPRPDFPLVSGRRRHHLGCREVRPRSPSADAEPVVSTPDTGGESARDPRAAFAELSKIMLGEQQLSETLGRVAELAKQTIPGVADVSVTLVHDSEVASVVFTGPLASHLDERQYEAGFGPCIDAVLSGTTIEIENTAESSAYPDFGHVAHRHGITHTLSTGLPV